VTGKAAEHLSYFEGQIASDAEFWRRFGRRPDFDGARVLDIGSGHGALSIEMARAGSDVLGIDLNRELVDFARENLQERHADVVDRVGFQLVDIADLTPDMQFDIAVSKDTFEHVENMGAMLRNIHRLLKPGGTLWAGFSPLYYSPNGDHRRTGLPAPAHALLPRRLVLRAAARHNGRRVARLADIGLNGMTPAAFRHHFFGSGFEIVSLEYNRGDKALLERLEPLRRLPPFEKYLTVSVYAVMRRPAAG